MPPIKRWFPDTPVTLNLSNDPQEMRGTRNARERAELLSSVSRVYAISNWVRDRFLDGLPADAEANRVVAINSPVRPCEHLVPKEKLILFVRRIVPAKGALLFAQAMRALLPAFPEWKAQMIGGVWHGREGDSDYSRAVAQEFAGLGSQGAITGYVPVSEVRNAMARASILCVPSLWNEPFGRVAVEGAAEGALVATTGRGGLREAAGNVGLFIDSEDPGVWAERLRPWVLDNAGLQAAAAAGRRHAEQFATYRIAARLDQARGSARQGTFPRERPDTDSREVLRSCRMSRTHQTHADRTNHRFCTPRATLPG